LFPSVKPTGNRAAKHFHNLADKKFAFWEAHDILPVPLVVGA